MNELTYNRLVSGIENIDTSLRNSTIKAINRIATMRHWLIGAYIVEYEQHGLDRAQYGDSLLKRIVKTINRPGITVTSLQADRLIYRLYPQIRECIEGKYSSLTNILPSNEICSSLQNKFKTDGHAVLSQLSFSHLRELIALEDPLVRFFYETECIKSTWSVRELHRQIATNLHIRVGLSKDKIKTMQLTNHHAEHDSAELQIRDPYTFEFLGLRPQDVYSENDLENALILHLQDFILELGKGFCFEARQKRLIIDDEYYFADLVFYNRSLHCNVIFELKNDEFRHEYLGQLNAYVGYYKENEMHPGDNPPIGVLLCTKKGKKMVEYALGGMEHHLFVSTYQLQLPNREELEAFIEREKKEVGND